MNRIVKVFQNSSAMVVIEQLGATFTAHCYLFNDEQGVYVQADRADNYSNHVRDMILWACGFMKYSDEAAAEIAAEYPHRP